MTLTAPWDSRDLSSFTRNTHTTPCSPVPRTPPLVPGFNWQGQRTSISPTAPEQHSSSLWGPFPAGEVEAECGTNVTLSRSCLPLLLFHWALVSHGKGGQKDGCECVNARMSTRRALGSAELKDAGATPVLEQ